MPFSDEQARVLLQQRGLRCTTPRLAVLNLLASQAHPLAYSELLDQLGQVDWDPATLYRNLVKLTEAGLTRVVSHADGKARYVLVTQDGAGHEHPHFLCTDCGKVACLPTEVTTRVEACGPWAVSVQRASLQLRGECPDCLQRAMTDTAHGLGVGPG